ncbi:hypothetical protein OZN48_12765 [Chryseobacterium indologenes]|nr:hypothetical protein [Chryseobacterium indologenes]
MKLEGFSKTIKTSKGNEYNLPDAEYYFSIEVSDDEIVFVEDILELAKQATGKKDNEYRAMTSELANNDSLKWHNFTLVESKKK